MNTEDLELKGQDKADALSSAALARRRMLLKGLGKGGAVLVASIPLQTLASTSICTPPGPDGTVIRCGISGMTSGIGSRETYTTCSGYSPGYYKFPDKHPWPTLPTGIGPDTPCKTVFSRCTAVVANYATEQVCTAGVPSHYDKKTKKWIPATSGTCVDKQVQQGTRPASLLEVLNGFENTDEFHWICAWLNGSGGAAALSFPYTGAQVIAFYNDTSNGTYGAANALKFFKTYMETR